jgi:hypothetical protein
VTGKEGRTEGGTGEREERERKDWCERRKEEEPV